MPDLQGIEDQAMVARLKEQYDKTVLTALREKFGYSNVMQVPRLDKIVINMGVGDAQQDQRNMDNAVAELTLIAGQKPAIRRARKSISNFKLREGAAIGCMVTLRGARMYEFLDRLVNVAVPRIRDFRGFSPNSFDGAGNYTLGLREQTIFPEVKVDSVVRVRGMNVTFVVRNARNPEESRELLRGLGFPFRA